MYFGVNVLKRPMVIDIFMVANVYYVCLNRLCTHNGGSNTWIGMFPSVYKIFISFLICAGVVKGLVDYYGQVYCWSSVLMEDKVFNNKWSWLF